MKGIDISKLDGNPIKQWIRAYDSRTDRNYIVGVMVGCCLDGENGEKLFNADYALCNGEYDAFDPDMAIKIAYGRARSARPNRAKQNVVRRDCGWKGSGVDIREEFSKFIERCQTYYKDCRPTGKANAFYCIKTEK